MEDLESESQEDVSFRMLAPRKLSEFFFSNLVCLQ